MATSIGAVLAYGVLRMSLVAVQTAQISSTLQAENDLSITIKRMLDDEEDCKWNLNPSRLSDSANKTGALPAEGWKNTQGNNAGSSPVASDDITILKASDNFRDGLLSIKSLELLKGGTATAPTYTFAVFYTKPHSGSYATLGDGACSADNKSGCYSKTCELEIIYDSSSPPLITTCDLKTCHGGAEGHDISCGQGEYLHGFSADGTAHCRPIRSTACPDGAVVTGFHTAESAREETDIEEGDPKCTVLVKIPKNKALECADNNKVLQGFNSAGEPVCTNPCTGGRVFNKNNSNCECPSGTTWNEVDCR